MIGRRIFFVFLLAAGPALSMERPDALSLSGAWSFAKAKPLAETVGSREGSFDPPKYFPSLDEVIPPPMRGDPAALLDERLAWMPVQVPSAWEQAAGIDYNGAGWYRLEVDVSPGMTAPGRRLWIEFDAAATAAGVWLNGKWLGGHVGDYVRFRVEATGAARPGSNELLVFVDELPGHIHQGFLSALAPHHGGLWQEVRLYATGPAALQPDGLCIDADPVQGRISVSAAFDGVFDPKECRAALEVTALEKQGAGRSFAKRPEAKIASLRYDADANRLLGEVAIPDCRAWSPQDPALYEAALTLLGPSGWRETCTQRFAFRRIEIQGSRILLNGKPVRVRSVLNWGWYPRLVSPAPPASVVREEFATYRSLGFNAETVCLMVLPDAFYDLADEEGMLIWEEYPTWHDEFTQAELPVHRSQFEAYFRRDRHHPSIVLRSLSVEAGVKDQEVMAELVRLAKERTGTPVQDNNSWFWLSNEKLTDWYGEDNYWNNDRWARHLLVDLPEKLDGMPEKPYLIGESMAGSVWPDTEALKAVTKDAPLGGGLTGTDAPHEGKARPYWFPRCFDDCLRREEALRRRYNPLLEAGKDIVKDFLLPQSRAYSLAFRRFQIRLLEADPRYAGWTFFLGRDVPACHSGLYDALGRPRWEARDFAWLGPDLRPPLAAAEARKRDVSLPIARLAPELLQWKKDWGWTIDREIPLFFLDGGYSDLKGLFSGWGKAQALEEEDLGRLAPGDVLVTSVLTLRMVDFLQDGGRVLLLTSRWPGALNSRAEMFWSDALFLPPAGPLASFDAGRLLALQMFDWTAGKSEVIPVQDLGLEGKVDPMLALFKVHDQEEVVVSSQLLATRSGRGLLIASSLDHAEEGGQWLLSRLLSWAAGWKADSADGFPAVEAAREDLVRLAVAKTNAIVSLNQDWRFKVDPHQEGEEKGWGLPGTDDEDWDRVQAARMWESQGYDYDGMAWYRKRVVLPEKEEGSKVVLVAEGVDDAYRLWINGRVAGMHGSFTVHAETVFMKQTETDITPFVRFGASNLIALQVVDVFGGGGINRPIYLRIE